MLKGCYFSFQFDDTIQVCLLEYIFLRHTSLLCLFFFGEIQPIAYAWLHRVKEPRHDSKIFTLPIMICGIIFCRFFNLPIDIV